MILEYMISAFFEMFERSSFFAKLEFIYETMDALIPANNESSFRLKLVLLSASKKLRTQELQ